MRLHRARPRFPGVLPLALFCFSSSVFCGGNAEGAEARRELSACHKAEVTQEVYHAEDKVGNLEVEWTATISPSQCSFDSFRKRIWTSRRSGVNIRELQVWMSIPSASIPLKELMEVPKLADCASGQSCFSYVEGSCASTNSCGTIELRLEKSVTATLNVMVTYKMEDTVCSKIDDKKGKMARLNLHWTKDWQAGWWVKHSIYRLCTYHPLANGHCEGDVSVLRPVPCLGDGGKSVANRCDHTVKVVGAPWSPYFEWPTMSSISHECDRPEDKKQETLNTPGAKDSQKPATNNSAVPPATYAIAAFGASIIFAGVACVLAHKMPIRRMQGRSNSNEIITYHMKDKLGNIPDDTSESTVASVRDSPNHRLRLNGGATPKARASPTVAIGEDLEAGHAPMRDRDLSSSSRNLQSTFNASLEEDRWKGSRSISSDTVDIQVDTRKTPQKIEGYGCSPNQHSESTDWDVMSDVSIKATNNAHRPSQNAVIAANAMRDIQMAAFPPVTSGSFSDRTTRSPAPSHSKPSPAPSNWAAISDAGVEAPHSSHMQHCGTSLLTLPATNGLAVRSESRRSNWDVMSDVSAGDLPSSSLNQARNLFGETDAPSIVANGSNSMQTIGEETAKEVASKPILYL